MALELDADGHLADLKLWSAQTAQALATPLGIELGEEHLKVLMAVREFYDQYDHVPRTRPLIKYLKSALPELELSNAKLQRLFNTGLVARELARVAGLPKPPHCL